MALQQAQPIRIEDPDEPFLKQAGEIAFEFISLRTQSTTSALSSAKKAPHYPKKEAGEPGLLRAEESEPEASPADLELLPASLPQLGTQGGQQQQQTTQQAQTTGHQGQAAGLQLATVAGGQQVGSSRAVSIDSAAYECRVCGVWGIYMALYIRPFLFMSCIGIFVSTLAIKNIHESEGHQCPSWNKNRLNFMLTLCVHITVDQDIKYFVRMRYSYAYIYVCAC